MGVIDTLVAVIPMLGILIVVHELGHFLVAKACGVRVLKFSIGFGAPIGVGRLRLRWERNGTEYVIGWIPLGGFVRIDALQAQRPSLRPLPRRKTVWMSSSPPTRRSTTAVGSITPGCRKLPTRSPSCVGAVQRCFRRPLRRATVSSTVS